MSDPTNAREYRLPSGEVMWISAAAVDAASHEGVSDVARKTTTLGGDGNELVDAPKDGNYQIGRGFFRFKQGDKIPASATFFESGSAPKVSTIGRKREAAAEKAPAKRGGAENQKGAGPDETS